MRVALLAVVLAGAGCKTGPAGSGRIDPVLAALVPGDTIMLSGVRLAELRTTPVYTQLSELPLVLGLDVHFKSSNFDPRKDVNELLGAYDGVDSVVLARGNFTLQAPDGMTKSEYTGATIYSNIGGSYAILDASTAVAGSERGIRKAIDQKQSGRPGPAALLDRARVLPGSGQIWFVSNGWGSLPESAAGQGGNLANVARVLQSLESATAMIDLRSGVDGDVRGLCRTDADAKTLSDSVRGMVGLGRLSVPQDQPEMLKLFDGIKVEQQQRSVQLNLKIPPDLIERLLQMTRPPKRG